jgi:hypothetical protein
MVFWREMGWNEEEEAVEALEGVCNMTDKPLGRNPTYVREVVWLPTSTNVERTRFKVVPLSKYTTG